MNNPDLQISTCRIFQGRYGFLFELLSKKSITPDTGLDLIMINAFELRVINELGIKLSVCGVPAASPGHVLTPLLLCVQWISDTGGITRIINLGTFILWLS